MAPSPEARRMTAEVARVGRGRPSAMALTASLDAARRINSNLRDELRAERSEGRELIEEIRAHASRVHLAVVADRADLALYEAGAVVALADRYLRQRGGGRTA